MAHNRHTDPVFNVVVEADHEGLHAQGERAPSARCAEGTRQLVAFEDVACFAGSTLTGCRRSSYDSTMPVAIAFDTHRFVKRLTGCGFTETLADEHVALLNSNLATKIDIAKLEARMEAIKSDLMKWMIDLLSAQGGLIVTLVKLLFRCRRRSIRGRSGNETDCVRSRSSGMLLRA